ncbi:MAG: putative zinc-binding protein [Methyloversatilis sp.]|nr:putative zinc-binding protein [Methyloversatilis sp.]MBP9118759.1 putative zinc-binding protein [Methyloversatilis sp.]
MGLPHRRLPLVYACSGCSSAAQMANHVAVRLDRSGVAEMSCIAGVGGDVPHLVRIARSGRPILALDGCPLECVRSCLAQRGLEPDRHLLLHEHGVKKRQHDDFDAGQAQRVYRQAEALALELAAAMTATDGLVQDGLTE